MSASPLPGATAPTVLSSSHVSSLQALPATDRLPVLFLGHGSPMNAIEDNAWRRSWQSLGQALRARGTQRIHGTVLRINRGMLELARALGFQESTNPSDPDDHETRGVSLDLQTSDGSPP